ncbi:hypothetical protein ACFO0N_08850 [Halobium salinum]|uniref:PGF-CTERM sorting domain-containing protein n=1 Tax=Halobium salinum TaxID=1364940 RepID=A0ABD5PBJ6_9EURY|nr:hypothetical protein [Halobium salinum]
MHERVAAVGVALLLLTAATPMGVGSAVSAGDGTVTGTTAGGSETGVDTDVTGGDDGTTAGQMSHEGEYPVLSALVVLGALVLGFAALGVRQYRR